MHFESIFLSNVPTNALTVHDVAVATLLQLVSSWLSTSLHSTCLSYGDTVHIGSRTTVDVRKYTATTQSFVLNYILYILSVLFC